MSQYLVDQVEAHPSITVRTETQVTALDGEHSLTGVTLNNAARALNGCAVTAGRHIVQAEQDAEIG
jgi:hypothetical protein